MFSERQKFNQWWVILLLVGLALIAVYGLVQQVFLGVSFGNNPADDSVLIAFFVAMVLVNIFFFSLSLNTRINEAGIEVKFSPFLNRKIAWKEIASAEVVDYGFIGGWGMRYSSKHGWVYATAGSEGLRLKLKNGKQMVIGTQRKEDLKSALANRAFS